MGLILLIVVLLLLFGGGYGLRQGWYAAPQFGGILDLILIILVLAWLFGGFGYGHARL